MNRKNPFIKDGAEFELKIINFDTYELECYVFNKNYKSPGLFIRNLESGLYNIGGDFFSYDWRIEEIKEDLITTIDEVIERNWGDEILVNNFTLVSAIIDPKKTYFTLNNNLDEGRKEAQKDENKQLETKTFRAITLF